MSRASRDSNDTKSSDTEIKLFYEDDTSDNSDDSLTEKNSDKQVEEEIVLMKPSSPLSAKDFSNDHPGETQVPSSNFDIESNCLGVKKSLKSRDMSFSNTCGDGKDEQSSLVHISHKTEIIQPQEQESSIKFGKLMPDEQIIHKEPEVLKTVKDYINCVDIDETRTSESESIIIDDDDDDSVIFLSEVEGEDKYSEKEKETVVCHSFVPSGDFICNPSGVLLNTDIVCGTQIIIDAVEPERKDISTVESSKVALNAIYRECCHASIEDKNMDSNRQRNETEMQKQLLRTDFGSLVHPTHAVCNQSLAVQEDITESCGIIPVAQSTEHICLGHLRNSNASMLKPRELETGNKFQREISLENVTDTYSINDETLEQTDIDKYCLNKSDSLKLVAPENTCKTSAIGTKLDHGESRCYSGKFSALDFNGTDHKQACQILATSRLTNEKNFCIGNIRQVQKYNYDYCSSSGKKSGLCAPVDTRSCNIEIKVEPDSQECCMPVDELSKKEFNLDLQNQPELKSVIQNQSNSNLINQSEYFVSDNTLFSKPSKFITRQSNEVVGQFSKGADKYLYLNSYFSLDSVDNYIKYTTKQRNHDFNIETPVNRNNVIKNPLEQIYVTAARKTADISQVTHSKTILECIKKSIKDIYSLSSGPEKRKSSEIDEIPTKKLKNNSNAVKSEHIFQGYANDSYEDIGACSTSSSIHISSTKDLYSLNDDISTKEHLQCKKLSRDPRLRTESISDVKLTSTKVQCDSETVGKEQHCLIQANVSSIPSQKNSLRDSASSFNQSFTRMFGPISSCIDESQGKAKRLCDILDAKDLPFLIIEWDPTWLKVQNETNEHPPILRETKINVTKTTYISDADYSTTYYGLHILTIWLSIYSSWKEKPTELMSNLVTSEKKKCYFKNICQSTIRLNDIPTHQGIILVTCISDTYTKTQCFGYVYDVKTKPIDHRCREKSVRSDYSVKKVKFSFYTRDKVRAFKDSTVIVQNLCRTRVAIKQYAALGLKEIVDRLKMSILNPMGKYHKIKIVKLPLHPSQSSEDLQTRIETIINSAMVQKNIFTLVEKSQGAESSMIILKLIRFLIKGSTILVCLKDAEKFFILASTLKEINNMVLAVKESEVKLPRVLVPFTLRAHASKLSMSLEKAELEILKESKLIMTLTSNVFLSDDKRAVLGSNLTCIVDDAHLTTEAETALLLSYNPNTVVLLGDASEPAVLHDSLQTLGYHASLFHRLFSSSRFKKLE